VEKRWLHDVAWTIAAALTGLASLGYPYGHDQALFGYVAREWAAGRLPYVATFDVKTPGIYATYLLASVLFGKSMWAIRVFDLVAVISLGWLAATFATPAGERPAPGLRGATAFAAAFLYYGFFYFWDTAQCESFAAVFAMAGLTLAARKDSRASVFGAGLCGGIAVLLKPPVAWLSLIAVAFVLRRAREGKARAFMLHGLGAVVPVLFTVAYFAMKHGLHDFYDIVVVNNRYYVIQGRWVNSVGDVIDRFGDEARSIFPAGWALVIACVVVGVLAWRRKDREIVLLTGSALASYGAVVGAVTMQLKFCGYHWVLMIAPFAISFALAAREASRAIGATRGPLASAVVLAAFFALTPSASRYWAEQRNFFAHRFGKMNDDDYAKTFDVPHLTYSYWWSVKMGEWAREHSSPDDTIAVRGFEPVVYIVAERHAPTRFFWTTPLIVPGWAYRAEDWKREDGAAIEAARPKIVFALGTSHEGIEAVEYFRDLGYVERERFGNHVALERP
jgi:hypothetical protein